MTSSERRVLEQKLEEVAYGRLDSLQINGKHLFGEDLVRVAQVIRHAPHLRSLGINDGLNEAGVNLIAEAVSHRSDIHDFGLTNIRISPGNAQNLAQGLAPNRQLKRLKFSWSVPESTVLDHLTSLVEDLPHLQQLLLSGGVWSQQSHDKLAAALADKKELVILELSPTPDEKAKSPQFLSDDAFEDALLGQPHPNLMRFGGNTSLPVQKVIHMNDQRRFETQKFIYQELNSNYDAMCNRITPQRIVAFETLYPALNQNGAFGNGVRDTYRLFLEQLPKLPEPPEGKTLSDALFEADAHGFTPLDNPHTWRNRPNLLAQLAEETPLAQALQRRSPKGMSVLEAAFAYLPAGQVIGTLNQANVQVQQHELLAAGNKPTPLLDILIGKHEIGALFTQANWSGGKDSGQMMACIRDLPEETRPLLPSLSGLRLQLDAQHHAQAGKGR